MTKQVKFQRPTGDRQVGEVAVLPDHLADTLVGKKIAVYYTPPKPKARKAPPASNKGPRDLPLTKAELFDKLLDLGIDPPPRATKATLVRLYSKATDV